MNSASRLQSNCLLQHQLAGPLLDSSELHSWLASIENTQNTGRRRSWYQVVKVARRLHLLQPAPQVVVVAGTNGKGTTVNFTEQLLSEQGVTVGSTFSPHLQRYNERIRINGQLVSDQDIVSAFEVIRDAQDDLHLSYHDYATLAGLWIFKQRQVDVAVLEVGVGGRFDAANIVQRDINVITSLALDHQEMLGPDLETIGWEKIGIARSGVPLIFGDSKSISTVLGRVRALNCPTLRRGQDFDYQLQERDKSTIIIRHGSSARHFEVLGVSNYPLSLALAAQITAILGFDMQDSALLRSPSKQQLPGRMELILHQDRVWLLDVAHNPEAITYLMRSLPRLTEKPVARVLLGTLKHKDLKGIVSALKIPKEYILLTSTQGRRGTTWKSQSDEIGIQCIEEMDIAYQELVANTMSGDLILVVGSFDVVGRLRTKISNKVNEN